MTTHDLARRWPVWALAIGQTLGYATFFYIFAALILPWQTALGWDKSVFATGPMLSILIAAGLAPVMGRVVDRGYGPEALWIGAVIGAVSLLWLAQIETPRGFLIGWAGLGVAQAACLYEVCFAFLIRRLGPDARAAIVRVTLVAGFASTLAFPAGAALAEAFGWRGAVLISAAVVAGVMVPLHILGARPIRRAAPPPTAGEGAGSGADVILAALRRKGFWRIALVFSLVSLNHWMIISFLVPIFVLQGATASTAVFAAATVGPAQVAGRLVLMRYEARVGNAAAARVTLAATVVAVLFLAAAGIAPVLIFLYTLTQGAALGVMTILRPVLIADVLGPKDYGTIAGVIQIPPLLASAAAPLIGALVLEGPGVGALLALSFGIAIASLIGVWGIQRTAVDG